MIFYIPKNAYYNKCIGKPEINKRLNYNVFMAYVYVLSYYVVNVLCSVRLLWLL